LYHPPIPSSKRALVATGGERPACGAGISTSLETANHPCFLPPRTKLQLAVAAAAELRKDGMKFQQRYTDDITRGTKKDATASSILLAGVYAYPETLNCEIFGCYAILRITAIK